jgi:diguanylate cyclase (GGDEF)-like protein
MSEGAIRHRLRTGATDPPLTSRVLGVFYLAGALLVYLSVLLPHPEGANSTGLLGIAVTASLVGGASTLLAKHARPWTVHTVLAAGTSLICLCVYFAGVAAGIYSAMFVWVVLVAVSFFSARAVAAHVAWAVIAWGLTLLVVEETTGFSTITRWTLGTLVLVVAAAVMSEIVAGRKSTEEQLRSAQDELEHLAHHDPLTGVPNRRLFESELSREMARAKRQGTPLSLVALDLDGFKSYNDQNGHVAGDRLLKAAASAWTDVLRATDLIARFGGDEFVAVLPACSPAEVELVAKRLCRVIPAGCTCSSGVAQWDGSESVEELLARADQLMYESKLDRRPIAAGARERSAQ